MENDRVVNELFKILEDVPFFRVLFTNLKNVPEFEIFFVVEKDDEKFINLFAFLNLSVTSIKRSKFLTLFAIF